MMVFCMSCYLTMMFLMSMWVLKDFVMMSLLMLITIFLISLTIYNEMMISWMSFWFLVTYSTGVLVMLMYIVSMVKMKMKNIFIFLNNVLLMGLFLGMKSTKMVTTFMNESMSTNFVVSNENNMFTILFVMMMFLLVLFYLSMMLRYMMSPSRMN